MLTQENAEVVLHLTATKKVLINLEPLAQLFREYEDGEEYDKLFTKMKDDMVLGFKPNDYIDFERMQEHYIDLQCLAKVFAKFKITVLTDDTHG